MSEHFFPSMFARRRRLNLAPFDCTNTARGCAIPFSDSILRISPITFARLRRRAVFR